MDNHPDLDRTVSATHSASTAQVKPPSTVEVPVIPPEVTLNALSGATFVMSLSVLSRGVPSRGSGTSCYHPEVARSMIRGAWFLTSSLNCRFFHVVSRVACPINPTLGSIGPARTSRT